MQKTITISPIGIVRSSITSQNKSAGLDTESRIIVEAKYAPSLKGLKEYSHLIVLYWLHEATEASIEVMVKPGNRPHLSEVGILATRNTTHRPNKIGLSVVRLLSVKSTVVKVIGLDAFNGSPVIDLKPFMRWDFPDGTEVERKLLHQKMELKFTGRILVPEWWRKF